MRQRDMNYIEKKSKELFDETYGFPDRDALRSKINTLAPKYRVGIISHIINLAQEKNEDRVLDIAISVANDIPGYEPSSRTTVRVTQ